jgi:hypothetical protein
VSPGQIAYESLGAGRAWADLTADERADFELGASLPAVGATLTLGQEDDRKVA